MNVIILSGNPFTKKSTTNIRSRSDNNSALSRATSLFWFYLSLALNKFQKSMWCCFCWLWTLKRQLLLQFFSNDITYRGEYYRKQCWIKWFTLCCSLIYELTLKRLGFLRVVFSERGVPPYPAPPSSPPHISRRANLISI